MFSGWPFLAISILKCFIFLQCFYIYYYLFIAIRPTFICPVFDTFTIVDVTFLLIRSKIYSCTTFGQVL